MLPRSTCCLRLRMVAVLARQVRSTTPGEIMQPHRSLYWSGIKTSPLLKRIFVPQNKMTRSMSNPIVEGDNIGTHKPTAFQKQILVWAKIYPSIDKVPERVTRNQLRVSMDRFRIRASIVMMAATLIAAAIYAVIGRMERDKGHTITKIALRKKDN